MYCTYKVLLHKLESRINDFRYVFNLYHIEHSIIVNHFRQYFDKICCLVLGLIFAHNFDGRIWAFYFTYWILVLSVTIERMYVNSSN